MIHLEALEYEVGTDFFPLFARHSIHHHTANSFGSFNSDINTGIMKTSSQNLRNLRWRKGLADAIGQKRRSIIEELERGETVPCVRRSHESKHDRREEHAGSYC